MFGSKKKQILESGVSARALITNVEDTGMTVNDSPRVKLTLQVQPDGEMPFEATKKTLVSRLAIPRVGDTLWVRYDQADHTRVEIDNARTDEVNAAVTATPANEPIQTTVKIAGGSTVIDARSVPGLRDELLKAVSDVRSGNPEAQAELQAAVMKAMSQGQALSAELTGAAAGAASQGGLSAQPSEDPLDRIKKLNDLRVAGALTDAEFEAQKAKILGES